MQFPLHIVLLFLIAQKGFLATRIVHISGNLQEQVENELTRERGDIYSTLSTFQRKDFLWDFFRRLCDSSGL